MRCSFSCWALTSAGQHWGADVEVYAHVLSPICVHYHLLQPAQCSYVVKCICLVQGSCRAPPALVCQSAKAVKLKSFTM